MLSKSQAQTNLENFYPDATIKAWTEHKDLFLFRIEHPDPEEKDWDPFFSVDKVTGEVRDFSVVTDLTREEFVEVQESWNDV